MAHDFGSTEWEGRGRRRLRPGAGGRKGWSGGADWDQESSRASRIRVGKPQVRPAKPSHVAGVREGNEPGSYRSQPGHLPDGRSTARRSTGINARNRNPIDPSSPNLSPP